MIVLSLVGVSLVISILLFFFGMVWFKIFHKIVQDSMKPKTLSMKAVLFLEFFSSFLLSLAVVMVFAPLDWYFGFINGVIIGVAIILPFAISDSIWSSNSSMKLFLVNFGHRFLQIIIAFTGAGVLNSLLFPFFTSQIM